MEKIELNNKTYTVDHVFDPEQGEDFLSESYEWICEGESVEDWTTLITTHKLSPLDPKEPLSSEVYAENIAEMYEEDGADILETSFIEDKKVFLLIYLYDESEGIELNIERVKDNGEGGIDILVYSERLELDESDLEEYFESDKFEKLRQDIVNL